MSVRSAKRGDEEAITHIGRESFTWAFGHLFPADVLTRYLDATYSAGKILSSISNPNNVYFVSEAEDRVVGFLKLKRSCRHFLIRDSRQLQVQKIYVCECRQHGYRFELDAIGRGKCSRVGSDFSVVDGIRG